MKQVFISNGLVPAAEGEAYNSLTRTAGGSATVEDVGIWSVTAGSYLDGDDEAASLVNTGVISPANKQFQLVSAQTTGNPIASPILDSSNVTSITYNKNRIPAKMKVTIPDSFTVATVVGDAIALKLTVRCPGEIAFYEAQINPSEGVTGAAINMAYDSPQRVFSTEIIATEAVSAGSATTTDVALLKAAIVANTTLNSLVTATINSGDLVLEANIFGMSFDAVITVDGVSSGSVQVNTTAPALGVGSYFEAISEEKKAAYAQGFFNRMYFPTGGETFASKGGAVGGVTAVGNLVTYDRITIEYKSSTNDMPGFNGAGVGNQVVLYIPAAGTITDYQNVFEFAAGTDVTHTF